MILKNIARNIKNQITVAEEHTSEKEFMEWLGLPANSKDVENDVTYFTCLNRLATTLGGMPLKYYLKNKGKLSEADKDDMAYLLTVRPNPYITPSTFWNAIEINRNHYGNAYVYVQMEFIRFKYGGTYKPVALWIMPSANTKILIDNAGIFGGKGKVYYSYQDKYSGETYIFEEYQIMHFTTSYTYNGICGLSVQDILRATIEGNIESQDYLNALYKKGLTSSAVLEYTGDMDKKAEKQMKRAFERLGSGVENAGGLLPIPLGFKVTPLNIKLTDAQFLELKRFTALQIAGAMGIKPFQINDYEKSSYNSNEQQQLNFLVDTIGPILKRYEEEINYKCLTFEDFQKGYYYKFNEKVMLRTDSKTQSDINGSKVDKGIKTINECRLDDDLPPVEGGDIPIVNGTYVPLTYVGQQYDSIAGQNEGKEGKGE